MLAAVQEYAWRAVLSADGTGVAVGACCDGLLAGGRLCSAGRAERSLGGSNLTSVREKRRAQDLSTGHPTAFVAFAWRTRASLGSLGRTLAACSPMRAVTLHSSQFTVLSLWRQRSDAQPREPSVQSRHRACTDDITCNVETRKSNRMSRMCLCRMCASKSSSFLAFKSAIYINRFLSLF